MHFVGFLVLFCELVTQPVVPLLLDDDFFFHRLDCVDSLLYLVEFRCELFFELRLYLQLLLQVCDLLLQGRVFTSKEGECAIDMLGNALA